MHRLPELRNEVIPLRREYPAQLPSLVFSERRWVALKNPARIAGGAAGLANGLFGGGGGMVFLPIVARWGSLSQRKLYATCVGVIFPVCAVSALVYLFRDPGIWREAMPYLAGGCIGGDIGGRLYGRVSAKWLKWLFAAFLFYGGVRYLW